MHIFEKMFKFRYTVEYSIIIYIIVLFLSHTHNKYSTHILCQNKLLFEMRLIMINYFQWEVWILSNVSRRRNILSLILMCIWAKWMRFETSFDVFYDVKCDVFSMHIFTERQKIGNTACFNVSLSIPPPGGELNLRLWCAVFFYLWLLCVFIIYYSAVVSV